jgi:hypothetical protein
MISPQLQEHRPLEHLPSSSSDLPAMHAGHADSTKTPASAVVDQKQPITRPSRLQVPWVSALRGQPSPLAAPFQVQVVPLQLGQA